MLLFARTASAQVAINEIMYKPNPNSGHEWIEVKNEGSDAIDFSYTTSKHWKLIQSTASVNEGGVKPYQGGNNLPAGGFGILAISPDIFLADHPGWSGILFDLTSLTSFNDTGATLTLADISGVTQDTAVYTSDMGASGDGNSLQKINGVWKTSPPTPGAENIFGETNTSSQNSVAQSSPNSPVTPSSVPASLQISAEAGAQTRVVLAGAPVIFEGRISGLENSPTGQKLTTWTFGDGASGVGETVSHTYYYPGDYTAVIDVTSGLYTATDRMLVRVVLPNISLGTGGDASRSFITLENQGSEELDLSGWQVVSGERKFIFPKNTILAARKTATFASEVTGLSTPPGTIAELMFPNGSSVAVKAKDMPPAVVVVPQKVAEKTPQNITLKIATPSQTPQPALVDSQEATVLGAFNGSQTPPVGRGGTLWPWYIAAAFLGVLALFGLRMTRQTDDPLALSADDFEIIEDSEPH